MPVVFYYHTDATLNVYFGEYTQGHDWNDIPDEDAPSGGPNDYARTEDGIRDTLMSKASQFASTKGVTDGDKFYKLVYDVATGKNKDLTVYILKGIHRQPQDHLSIGFAGTIYHLNVQRRGDDNHKFSVKSMSEGGQTWNDPEWTVKKSKY